MLSWKFILSFPVFAQLITLSVADDPTYWVHSSCKAREGFEEALAEVLWGSGQLADALEARDSRQSERLQWLFNFDLDDSTPLGYAIGGYSFPIVPIIQVKQQFTNRNTSSDSQSKEYRRPNNRYC